LNVEVGGGHKVFVVGTWLLRLRDEIAEERARGVVGCRSKGVALLWM